LNSSNIVAFLITLSYVNDGNIVRSPEKVIYAMTGLSCNNILQVLPDFLSCALSWISLVSDMSGIWLCNQPFTLTRLYFLFV